MTVQNPVGLFRPTFNDTEIKSIQPLLFKELPNRIY